jgi:microcin C transport system substrate-binding protein
VNAGGEPMQFEILLDQPTWERISGPFAKNLERLGVQARIRTVDAAQFQNRIDGFDFDMIVAVWGQSLSPGNEQRDFWHSSTADLPGSRNLAGIKDPVVDRLIEAVIAAPDRASLIARTRALDRALLWGHHVIPHWHIQSWRIAYWDRFRRPAKTAKYNLGFDDTWWVDPKQDAELTRRRSANR